MDSHELPLSHGQRALWFLQRLRPEAAAWNIAAAARVRGRLDSGRLRRAFERLTERHDALRLSFHDGPVQRLHPESRLDFLEEEWEDGVLPREAGRPFDLERDPLLRVRLLRTGGDDVLLLVIHHLVADLGSLAVIVRELGPLYDDGTLPDPPPAPYAAFVARERERLATRAAERHWEHWRKRLAGELPVCELPADRPRPAVRTFRGGTRTRRMDLQLPAGRALPFLVAGLDVLLHRASGQTDLLVGSPTSGRLAPELGGTVGYLVNPVVLRSDLSGSPTFGQLLERVRSVALGALRHQECPFPLIVERLQPERDPARPPVFQVMLSFQRAHLPGTGDLAAFALGIEGAVVRTGPLALESLPLARRSSQLDLELMAAETSRGLELALTFNADLFEPTTAERLLGHLETLLKAAARDPERRIGELPLLSAAERQQLLEWNATERPLPERSVPELFEEQAGRTPDAVAVGGMTYRELSERSDAVARSLSGLSPEEPVGVLLERGPELAVAVLGILKAGGVYLPLNPDHPEARLARMLELSGAGRVLEDVGAGLAPAREGVNPSPTPDNLAYLLFTSGSTGDPKGALVSHRGLLNHLVSKRRGLGLSPADRVAQTAPQSFDIHIWQLLAPLLAGARVEVIPDAIVRDPARLLAEIDERGITVLQIVPSLLAPLLDEVEKGGGESLRVLVTIGEALPPELARRWLAARPGVPLVNDYGPTECADGVSDAWLRSVPEGETHTSIGRPIPNLRLHVLSPELEPQPAGFPGELCIAGAGVGRGYLGDPARSAAAFIPEPGGGRLYRTGDLGRRRPDGEIEVLGRLDHQIKHRGVRIEPGEIEAALAAHPGVREAVAAVRDGRLVAWWTGDPEAGPELRDHLLRRLPLSMVPTLFQRLDALPLTAHGKLDRRALPDPAPAAAAGETSPGDGMEQLLAEIFGAVLGREKVGPRDDFFALGGHSLLAAQVSARVREALGIEPPLGLLFEEPTVAGLARRLRGLAGLPSASAVPRAPREGRLPLSYAQEGLWLLHRLDPGSPAYNMPGLVRLPGSTDAEALSASLSALSAIVARHEALRTTFPTAGGEPYQEIGPAVPVPVPVVDLSALPDADREARRLASEEGRRPFDLARSRLLRGLLLRLGPEEQRLVVVLHHIAADGWSLGVLLRETSALLRGEVLPEPAVQYADYAVWQRRWPAERLDRLLAWWTGRLAGLAPLELPTDRPRPPARSFRGGLVSMPLPAGLSSLARGRRATPFLLTLAAWQVLLHRLTGQDDVAVGSPVANRSRPELEGLVGLFVNNLVLRVDLSGEPAFAEALARVREAALLAFAHQDLPFERLAAELAPERDPSRPPLFQVAFSFQEAMPPLDLGLGRRGAIEELGTGTSRLELWLRVEAGAEGWSARAEYATDLFDAATVGRWLGHLRTLLEGIAASPEARISDLPLLAAEEIAELASWNRTAADVPREPVHRLFRRQAERTPDALAIAWHGGRLTYGELARRAGRLAGRLRAEGVGPETVVALRLERSPDLVTAALAVLEAGGAYLPVDPAHPEERARWILEDSGALLELTAVPEGGEAPSAAAFDPDLLAYVIYTSGSTGTPKGTELRHRGLSSLVAWHVRTYGLGPADRTTLLAAPGFDASVWETWAALTCGASLHVPLPETLLSPPALLAWMKEQRITVSFLPTPLAEAVLALPEDSEGLALRVLLTGGDRLRLRPAPGLPFDLVNHYGPTEGTVVATAGRVAPEGETAPAIGWPIANTRVHVLDRNLRPVPINVAGELCLAGEGLARAYRGRPELTAERFVPSPFGEGERLYRTGDLARRLADGSLQFLGRTDHQVKIRGLRVEPGEIEAALRRCPGVREAVAAVRDGRLAAWYAREPGQEEPSPGRLREWLLRTLPEAMVPALFAAVEALPLTPSGKIDRRALPDPVPAAEAEGAPAGPIEETVAEVWSSVLGIEGIGRHRGFFELGGHSLLAARVMSRVNQAFRTDLPLRALFEAPTVAGLALLVSSAGRDRLPMPALRRVPRGRPLALSFAQERLWVMDRLLPDSPLYNVFQALDLPLDRDVPLDESALERALAGAARRHETLRTRFAIVEGRPMQVVEPHRPRPLPVVDLRGLSRRRRLEEADRLAGEEARRPFDLLRGPLLRFALLRLGESSRLLLGLHHIVCDGWSLDLLAREMGALYRGLALPELPFQYADYADWQRRWPAELLDGQLAWWKERLAGLAALEIQTGFPRPPVRTFRGGMVLATLPPDLIARLRKLARERHATFFMLLLAGWQTLLHRWTGQEDVAVGTPVANRSRPEIEGVAGFFANDLVLRADLSGKPGFADVLERVREAALSALSRQDLPFERLVAELSPERDLSRPPLFQVAFSFQEALPPLDLGTGLRAEPVDVHTGTSKFDLWLQVREGQARAEYAADLFDAATVRRWLGCLRVLLEGIAAAPEARICELPLLSQAERHHLLVEWNDTGRGGPAATVHQLVEEQAARTPGAVAVLCGDERLTYAELNLRADRLADRLLALGVQPEARVALLAERSPETIVALLAILKAGAAYAPLDPELPAERLAFLLDDLRPPVVLAQERLLARLPACAAAVVHLEEDGPLPACPRTARPAVTADSLAYVLHTSGSTGRPKGVAAVHRGVVRLVRDGGFADLGPSRTLLQLAPLSFDASTLEIWGALANGGRLVLFPPGVPTFEALGRTVARHGVDTLWLTAALFHRLVDDRPSALLPVRQLLAGGDRLSPAHVRKVLELLPDGVVINGYGPTESTTFACCHTMRDVRDAGEPVAIGRPIGGTRVYVLDRDLRPVPPGVPGELFIGGDGLARGYHGQPALTAERFLPGSLDAEPGGRLYRTGDLARWLPDGNLRFLGRIDRQVKIRGIRVEPEEIEAALRRHPGVREAAVLAREDRPGDRRLAAYYVPEPEREPSPDQLRAWLRGKLPEPMVPAAFVPLGVLPLTPGGKVDRRALPAPASAPVAPAAAPRTPLESLVAGVCSEVLGIDEVPRDVSFFDLGGNSLLATRVVTLIEDVLPVALDLRQVLERPTVARMAEIVEEERRGLAEPERLAMDEILAELERSLAAR